MKVAQVIGTAVLGVALVGCNSPPRANAIAAGRLNCPTEQGELVRVSAAADGKTCAYRMGSSVEVSLELLPLVGGSPQSTLQSVETNLKSLTKSASTATTPAAKNADAMRDVERALAEADADVENAGATDPAMAGAKGNWDDKSIEAQVDAKLREKGIEMSDTSGGDSARVDLPGIHINASDDSAVVRVGPIHVDARGDTATIRSFENVRLRGQAFSHEKRGLRAMLILAGDSLGNGYKFVGYEASGPQTGPLVVAVVKSRSGSGFHDSWVSDVKRLVRRNGGT